MGFSLGVVKYYLIDWKYYLIVLIFVFYYYSIELLMGELVLMGVCVRIIVGVIFLLVIVLKVRYEVLRIFMRYKFV